MVFLPFSVARFAHLRYHGGGCRSGRFAFTAARTDLVLFVAFQFRTGGYFVRHLFLDFVLELFFQEGAFT